MHVATLFVVFGDKAARAYLKGLTRNGIRMVSSNGEVKRRVSEGDCAVGITDSDDAYAAIKATSLLALSSEMSGVWVRS